MTDRGGGDRIVPLDAEGETTSRSSPREILGNRTQSTQACRKKRVELSRLKQQLRKLLMCMTNMSVHVVGETDKAGLVKCRQKHLDKLEKCVGAVRCDRCDCAAAQLPVWYCCCHLARPPRWMGFHAR